jgi:hypothetical protein
LLTITVAWCMYIWFLLIVRWAPMIFDTLIPIMLGTLEMG